MASESGFIANLVPHRARHKCFPICHFLVSCPKPASGTLAVLIAGMRNNQKSPRVMKIVNALPREIPGTCRRSDGKDSENSPRALEQLDAAAESRLAEIQMEQELDRIWFDCFLDLAEHHRNLRSTGVLDLWAESAQGHLAEHRQNRRSERAVGRPRPPKL